MKKLNITKEQFEKSRYFKDKYGKLEYVSESGRLFKTDKGKVLKFRESKNLVKESVDALATPENVKVDDILYCTSYYDYKIQTFYKVLAKRGASTLVIQRVEKKYDGTQSDGVATPGDKVDSRYKPITVRYGKRGFKVGSDKLYIWDGSPLEEYNYSESDKKPRFGRKFKESFNMDDYADRPRKERPKFDIGQNVSLAFPFDPKHGWVIEDVREAENGKGFEYFVSNDEDDHCFWCWDYELKREANESSKKFGKKFSKKFNEGGNPAYVLEQDLDSLKEQCNAGAMSFDEVEDILIGLGFKLDHGGTPSGKADDDSQWMVYEHPEGYCAQLAYEFEGRGRHKRAGNVVDFDWIYDDSIKSRYNESGRKFKESASDIANDPAYKCPYCGSTDCEFDTAEDIGTGLTEGYFDGATFIAQYFCNKCGKPYNVQFQLKVKDVYPNEDADELTDDWA